MPRGINDYDTASLQGRNVSSANTVNVVSPGIITSGMLVHLDAGNRLSYPGTGATWFDISGNGYNQTLSGSVSTGSDHIVFSGGASSGPSGLLTGNVAASIELWANFTVIGPTRWWLATISQFSGSLILIGTSATSTQFGIYNGNSISVNLQGTNQWLHLVTSFNKTNLTSYVNGVASGSTVSGSLNLPSPTTLWIAQRTLLGEANFNGKISVVRVYNRALTPDEVFQNFNATRTRFGL